jgi:hypothetical protein
MYLGETSSTMVVKFGIDAILAALTCSLRYTSFLFVRWVRGNLNEFPL